MFACSVFFIVVCLFCILFVFFSYCCLLGVLNWWWLTPYASLTVQDRHRFRPTLENLLAVTFYQCLHGLAPSYLAQSVRRVAELDRRRLTIVVVWWRRHSNNQTGDCWRSCFTAAGSRLWNSLPPDIRSAQTLPVFCNRLKTYHFSKCFLT